MRRREVVAGLVGAVTWPRAARGQPLKKVPRIGFLSTRSIETPDALAMLDAFRQGLRERGYVEGQNIVIEIRGADGKVERFPERAIELVALKLDVIVATR